MFDAYHKWLGIPPADQPPNYYRLLGIAVFEDDSAVIEHAADQRLLHLRTFQSSQENLLAEKLLNEVTSAKICLLKPDRKAQYDASLRSSRGLPIARAIPIPDVVAFAPQPLALPPAPPDFFPQPAILQPATPPANIQYQQPAAPAAYDQSVADFFDHTVNESQSTGYQRTARPTSQKKMPIFVIVGPLVGVLAVIAALVIFNAREDDSEAGASIRKHPPSPQIVAVRPAGIVRIPPSHPNTPNRWKEVDKHPGRSDSTGSASDRAPITKFDDPKFKAWMKEVESLPTAAQVEAVAKTLQSLNPGFDGKETHKIEFGMVTEFGFVADDITDISPVRALADLKKLTCTGSRPSKLASLSDLSPLGEMKLTFMDCGSTSVSDLSPLHGMPLTTLRCAGTPIADLSALEGMPLTFLDCGATQISNLSNLQQCSGLKFLNVKGTKITSAAVATFQKSVPQCKIDADELADAKLVHDDEPKPQIATPIREATSISPIPLSFEQKVNRIDGRDIPNDEQTMSVFVGNVGATTELRVVGWIGEGAERKATISLQEQPEPITVGLSVTRGSPGQAIIHIKPWLGPPGAKLGIPCSLPRLKSLQDGLPTMIDNMQSAVNATQQQIQNLEAQIQSIATSTTIFDPNARQAAILVARAHLNTQRGKLNTEVRAVATMQARLAELPGIIAQVETFVGTPIQFRVFFTENHRDVVLAHSSGDPDTQANSVMEESGTKLSGDQLLSQAVVGDWMRSNGNDVFEFRRTGIFSYDGQESGQWHLKESIDRHFTIIWSAGTWKGNIDDIYLSPDGKSITMRRNDAVIWVANRTAVANPRSSENPDAQLNKIKSGTMRMDLAVVRHISGMGSISERLTLLSDGTTKEKADTTWTLHGTTLTVYRKSSNAPGGAWIDRCELSPDMRNFRGENQGNDRIQIVVLEGSLSNLASQTVVNMSVVGRWTWTNNAIREFRGNGLVLDDNNEIGTWKILNRDRNEYAAVLTRGGGAGITDTFIMSADGQSMQCHNDKGMGPWTAVRVGP